MPHVFEGALDVGNSRWAIAVARYNEHITQRLLTGALETLRAHGAADDAIDVFWVPGAFELPVVASRAAESKRYHAVICLGAVIRGETTHDQHINTAMSHYFAEIGVRTGVPVLFGVLTCDTLAQALHRAGGNAGTKGAECAEAALRMSSLLQQMP